MSISPLNDPKFKFNFLLLNSAKEIESASGLLSALSTIISTYWLDTNRFDWALCQSLGFKISALQEPPFVQQALLEPCPFFPDRKVGDTHYLIQPFNKIGDKQANIGEITECLNAMHNTLLHRPTTMNPSWLEGASSQILTGLANSPKQWVVILKPNFWHLLYPQTSTVDQNLLHLKQKVRSLKCFGYSLPSAKAALISHFLGLALRKKPDLQAYYSWEHRPTLPHFFFLTIQHTPLVQSCLHATPMRALHRPPPDPIGYLPRLFQEP